MTLFVIANHMLLVYCVGYAIANSARAFLWMNDATPDAIAVSVFFWLLSIWLLVDSVLYYSAFLDEMDAFGARAGGAASGARSAATSAVPVEGTGIVSITAVVVAEIERSRSRAATTPSSGGEARSPSTIAKRNGAAVDTAGADCDSDAESFAAVWHRWTRFLPTEVGIAYALNIVGSLGYVISSTVSVFVTVEAADAARSVDRAALWIDLANMIVFSVDGILFFRVWWKESDQTTGIGKMKSIYFWANLCNTASSVCYLAFVAWSLQRRRELSAAEPAHAQEDGWYDTQLEGVTRQQRTMYFASDLVYLLYSLLLEFGWRREKGAKRADQLQPQGIQLKEMV